MKQIATTLALLTLAAPAFAQMEMDTDGDGNVSLEELQAAYPEVGEERFTLIDTDEDGVINEAELTAAQDAGLLPS